MLRLAIVSGRRRLGTFSGALVALFAAAVFTTAWGMQLEAVLRSEPPVERYAGTAAVVTAHQIVGPDRDVPLGERARVSSALTSRLAGVPGVRAAIGDVSVPVRLGSRAAIAHGWGSAPLTPYVLTAGRAPTRPREVVAGYQARLGARLSLASTEPARSVTVVGVARPRHAVSQPAIFLTDAEAERLSGHPGRVDAIGVLAGPDLDALRLREAAGGARVMTGDARGQAEHPDLQSARVTLIPVMGAFTGLALFIAMFVVISTMGLSIQQREREIALLRAVAATPGQIRRMIGWEAVIVGLVGSAAGVWPGMRLGEELGHALVRHGIVPSTFTVDPSSWIPGAAAIAGGVTVALLAVLAAGRRAARVRPTVALADAAVEPRLLGPGRLVGGLLAMAGAVPLFLVSTTAHDPGTAAATSEMTAIMLVVAVGFLGPIVARLGATLVGPPLAALSPVGGFLASANLGAATRRFSSASTPLVLSVAMSCTLLFSSTTIDHAITEERRAGLTGELAITSSGPGLPHAALNDVRATRGVRSAVALTPTSLGPGLGVSDDITPAQIVDGGQGGGLDVGVTSGSLAALRGDAIALGRHRADATHARVGEQVGVTLGDGSRSRATVVAIYSRDLGFGDALLAPELAAGHQTTPLLGTILVRAERPDAVAQRLRALARRYPGLRVDDRAAPATVTDADRELNRWLGPMFVAMIFGFTSIAVLNTLAMIGLRRGRELGLLQLVGSTRRQVRSMARWEAGLIVLIGLGLGLAITAVALLPLSHAVTGSFQPYVPTGPLAAILGGSAVLAFVALALPTRRALRTRPVQAIGAGE